MKSAFKIGQREFTALLFVVTTLLALLLGTTPENAQEVLTQVIGPLAGIGLVLKVTLDTITKRVDDGTLRPGQFLDLLKQREFVYAVILLGAGVFSMLGIEVTDESKQQYVEIATNFITLVIGPMLLKSWQERPSKSQDPKPPVPELPAASGE